MTNTWEEKNLFLPQRNRFALQNNPEIELVIGDTKLKAKGDGTFLSLSDCLDRNEERRQRAILFNDSIQQLKASRNNEDVDDNSDSDSSKGGSKETEEE